jgi:peptide/nickel transport system permease protein
MVGYIVRRLLQALPTLLLISVLLFVGMQLVPGGPMAAFAFNARMPLAAREAILHRWGLDQPLYIQYIKWLASMLQGDWQFSFFAGRPVKDLILEHLPATAMLMGTAYVIQELIALPSGILAALRRYSFFDQFVTFFSYVGYSMPTFWLGLMMLMVFAVFLHILPVSGIVDLNMTSAPFLTQDYKDWFQGHVLQGLLDIARHLVLPATTIAIVGIAIDSRYMRASMLDTLHQDYIRTARAKGLPERTVILKHSLRNALLPVVTSIGLQIPALFSGAIVTESIFSWPGMGQLFFGALTDFDYTLIMGILFTSAILFVVANIVADISYALIDPRISYA